MNNGWIKLHRQVNENAFCRNNLEHLGFWVLLLTKANHEQNDFYVGYQKVACLPGQFITGRRKLALEANVTEMKVERWLSVLESAQQIEQQKNTKFRLITIVNWKSYQSNEQENAQQMNNKRTTSEQQVNTNKNENNDKNEKNTIGSDEPVVEIVKNKKKDTNVSSDAVYGNEFINYIAKVFKDNLGTQTMDGTTKENRYSASRLWKRVLKESNGDTNRAKENIRIAIENGFKNDWHARSMNKISYLEKNFLTLYKLSL
jgi:hypothetical protein